jgi:septum formation protein
LGIVLTEWVKSEDPTALIGLPLIKTAELLEQCGVQFY